jgi:putative phosphoribosyl transferase
MADHFTSFADRRDAGRRLAAALSSYKGKNAIVLALPRGGVPVGYEVARALAAPLDVALVRKLGAPGYPELGIGAVVDGNDPQVVLNDDVVQMVGASPSYIEAEAAQQLVELERRRRVYRESKAAPAVAGRTVILVDDGIATGGTVRAVLRALRRSKPSRLVLAVPVAPRETLGAMRAEADDVICLATPEPFYGVGAHYRDFEQTTDEEVIALLADARKFSVAA